MALIYAGVGLDASRDRGKYGVIQYVVCTGEWHMILLYTMCTDYFF